VAAPPASATDPASTTTAATPTGIQLVNGGAGDQALLDSLRLAMGKSPTAAKVLEILEAGGARVRFVSDAEMEALEPGSAGFYNSEDNTLTLSRDMTAKDPEIEAITFAHEGTHFSHDAQLDADKQKIAQSASSMANPDAYIQSAIVETKLATETEAYLVSAHVGLELGLKPPAGGHPGINPDGSLQSFEQTWEGLRGNAAYNPLGLAINMRAYNAILPQ
jgi:hypothetical protein